MCSPHHHTFRRLAAVLAIAGLGLAAVAATDATPTGAQEIAPPGGLPADIGVSGDQDMVVVGVEFSRWIDQVRYGRDGRPRGAVRMPLYDRAYDVAVDADTLRGYAATVKRGRLEMWEFKAVGEPDHTWPTGYGGTPVDLDYDERGKELTVVMASGRPDDVQVNVLNFVEGTLRGAWSTGSPRVPTVLARDPARSGYLAAPSDEGGTVRKFDLYGASLGSWTLPIEPLAAAASDQEVYVAGRGRWPEPYAVVRTGPNGESRGSFAVGGLPLDLAVGPDGDVYVLVQGGGGLSLSIEKFTFDGRLLLRWSALSRMHLPALRRRS